MTEIEEIVLKIIQQHTSKNKIYDGGIRSQVLVKDPIGKKGAGLRAIINSLRQRGYPICSDQGGYWFATNKNELIENTEALRGRAIKILEAVRGMEKAVEMFDEVQAKLL